MGRKMTIYLTDGNEHGPKTIELGNWSGKAIYSQRANVQKIINRSEFKKPGVYILKYTPLNDVYSERIYIGEAEILEERIKGYLTGTTKEDSEEFTEIIVFISKDELLTKAHIKYLESHIIRLAKEAKNAEIKNSNQPRLPSLHEADISDMDYFLDQIKLILPIANFTFLLSSVRRPVLQDQNDISKLTSILYHLKHKEVKANLYESEEGYIVTAGSHCKKEAAHSLSVGWLKQRKKLLESEILKDLGKYYTFSEDTIFSSPSAAASVILGKQSPGPIMWIDENNRTFKENQINQFKNVL